MLCNIDMYPEPCNAKYKQFTIFWLSIKVKRTVRLLKKESTDFVKKKLLCNRMYLRGPLIDKIIKMKNA
jgi:hypothetical protein